MFTNLAPCVTDFLLWSGGLLLAVLIVGFFVRQPARRIALWWATVVGIAALAMLAISPRWSAVHLRSEFVPPAMNELPSQQGATGVPPVGSGDQRSSQDIHWRHASGTLSTAKPIDWPNLLLAIYLGGAVVTGGWLVLGYIAARGLVRGAKSASERVTELATQLGLERLPHLMESHQLASAVALGLWRPTVVLPREFCERVSDEELRSVLAHELAHVRQGDLWLLAALVTLAPLLWCQPLFWLLRRRVRLDQETLADAAAADHTTRPAYAANLVAWARSVSGGVRPAPFTATVGLWESPAQLKARIATLLDDRLVLLRHTTRRWRLVSMIAIATLAGGLSLVTWAPAGEVQEKAKTPESDPKPSITIETPDRFATQRRFKRLWDEAKKPNVLIVAVIDSESRPVSDVALRLYISEAMPTQKIKLFALATGTTDSEGVCAFKNLIDLNQRTWKTWLNSEGQLPGIGSENPVIISAIARKPGHESQYGIDIAARILKEGVVIQMQLEAPAASLTGRVVDQAGKPVVGALVNGNGRNFGSMPLIQFTTTDDNGEFSIADMKAVDYGENWEVLRKQRDEERQKGGNFFLMVGGDDIRTFFAVTHPDFAEAAVPYSKIPSNHDIVLRPGGNVEGRLVDADTNQPVPNTRLQLSTIGPIDYPPQVKAGDPPQLRFLATDDEGRFNFRSLRAGSFRLAINKAGLYFAGDPTSRPKIALREGETLSLSEVMVTTGKRVAIQLVDAKTRSPLKFDQPSSTISGTAHRYGKPPEGSKALNYSELIGPFEIEFDVSGKGQCQLPLGTYSIYFGNVIGWQETPRDDPKVPRVVTITDDENQIIEIPMEQREPQIDGALFRAN